jgi:hypothetical protein
MAHQPLTLWHPKARNEALITVRDVLYLLPLVMTLRTVYRNHPLRSCPRSLCITHTISWFEIQRPLRRNMYPISILILNNYTRMSRCVTHVLQIISTLYCFSPFIWGRFEAKNRYFPLFSHLKRRVISSKKCTQNSPTSYRWMIVIFLYEQAMKYCAD